MELKFIPMRGRKPVDIFNVFRPHALKLIPVRGTETPAHPATFPFDGLKFNPKRGRKPNERTTSVVTHKLKFIPVRGRKFEKSLDDLHG